MKDITYYYITTEPPIICNKSEIKENEPYVNNGVIFYADSKFNIGNNPNNSNQRVTDHNFKIIAGLPNQLPIDYSALSGEECKEIEVINFSALEKDYNIAIDERFKEGFLFHKSLNDKKWSDADIKFMYRKGFEQRGNPKANHIRDCFEQLKQPKVFEIEAIVQDNKVKILKVL